MAFTTLPGPFQAEGDWFRGALHVHTTDSDGAMPPTTTVQHYRRAGFDFLALTDHNRVGDSGVAADLLVLPGLEVDLGRSELGQRYHVVGVGFESGFQLRPGLSPQELIDEIAGAGGLAWLAHPYWSGLTSADLLNLHGYFALEVFNAACDDFGRCCSQTHWDELLTRGHDVKGLAVDDLHWPASDICRGWVMVRTRELTREAVVRALREGLFYASTGPQIYHVSLADDRVGVECSAARTINLVCNPTLGSKVTAGREGASKNGRQRRGPQGCEAPANGQLLTGAAFRLTGQETYGRVQVTDEYGHVAWTNALFRRTP
jgi:hypothetical protein